MNIGKNVLFPKMAIFFGKKVSSIIILGKDSMKILLFSPIFGLQIGILLSYLGEAMRVVSCEQVRFSSFLK